MKKLEIHRDTPEPSIEDMEKHMNFEEVLDRAASSPSTPTKGISKSWIVGGITGVTAVITTVLLLNRANVVESTYKNQSMTDDSVEKITTIASIDEGNDFQITPISSTVDDNSDHTDEDNQALDYDDYYPPVEATKIEYLEPKIVGSITFSFDESFGLKDQWKQFPELSIYENLVFQPIDKLQSSLLKVEWDKVKFNKDESGQYYLTLFKGDQTVFCAVAPVFEKEDFVDALEVYQGHQ